MTEKGQYPLVYQLEERNGVLIPVGLAEASSLGSFSAVNIVVSSISATDYLGFEANVSFTGVISVTTTGTGQPLVSLGDPNNPVIRSLATPTTNFLAPGLAGDGTVEISFGGDPLGYDNGGTNSTDTPTPDNVAFWYNDGSETRLITDGKFKYDTGSSNLSIGVGGQYQINGSQLALTDLANVNAPGSTNTFLQWNGSNYIWTGVCGTVGGGVSFPTPGGRIPVTDSTTNLNTYADLAYNSSTKVLSTYAINNVCDVCAIRFNEGGTLLSDKFQGKDDTLVAIAGLNPGINQLIYFTNTNVAATASVTPCALELLGDATFADMRTTLELNTYYQPIGAYLTAIPDQYLTQAEGDGLYQPCDVFLTTLASQNYVDLETADVCNTLPINKGGTNNNGSYGSDGIFYYDSGLQQFTNNSNILIAGTGGSAYIKSPNVCATTVCATTIQEGGQTLTSKYLTQANAAVTYQVCDTFLNTLATNDSVRLDLDVTNTLGVTRGGTGFNSISNNQIVVGTGTDTIGTIAAPTGDTYLRYNGGAFAWSVIPTGTGTTLPTDPCAVVFMNTTGTALASNKGIRVNNSASTLEIFSNLADGTGGLNIAPDIADEGFLRWDHNYDTLGIQGINNTNISLGVDDLIPIVNKTGVIITRGAVVYVSGAESAGYRGRVGLLSNTNRSASILGVCLADIANNATGYAIKKGLIKNRTESDVKESGETWTSGDQLYVGTTPGRMTNIHPAAGNRAAKIGIIVDRNGENVTIGVNVDRGYDLSELHDVCATPSNNGDILVWNTAGTGYYTTGTINNVTGTLAVTKGGTGKTSFTANQLIYGTNFAQDSNLYYSNNVLYASAASATTNVSAGGSTYGGNASIAGYVLATGDIATLAGTVFGLNVCGTNLFQGATNINAIYQPIGSYQPNSTRLHDLTAVTVDGLLRFNGSTYVTQSTATYETTAYSRATYETTGYARNTYETTGYSRSTYETTGYSRNTFALTASLASYETTAYSRPNFATTASLASYETTAYSRPNFATTASLASYTTTASFNTFSQGVTDNKGIVFANGTNLDTTNTLFFEGSTNTLRVTTVSSNSTYFIANGTSKSADGTLAWYDIPTNVADSNAYTGGLIFVTGVDKAQINSTITFDEANSRLKVTNVSATNYNNLALSSQLSDVQITATITNGYALKWNSSLSKWTPQLDQTGGGGATPVGNEGAIQLNREGVFYGDETKLMFVTGTNVLKTSTVSATTVSAGTIHVGGSDGYIRNNNGSIGISSIGGSVSISGTGSVSLQGIPIDETNWPQAGTGPAVSFYSHTANELLNVRLNSSALNGTRAYDGILPHQGYIVASYLASANNDYFGINSFWNTPGIPGGAPDLPTNKDVLVYNNDIYGFGFLGSKGWTWEQLSLSGQYLSDVTTTSVKVNDTLVYNGTTWAPKPSNGISSLLGNNLIL